MGSEQTCLVEAKRPGLSIYWSRLKPLLEAWVYIAWSQPASSSTGSRPSGLCCCVDDAGRTGVPSGQLRPVESRTSLVKWKSPGELILEAVTVPKSFFVTVQLQSSHGEGDNIHLFASFAVALEHHILLADYFFTFKLEGSKQLPGSLHTNSFPKLELVTHLGVLFLQTTVTPNMHEGHDRNFASLPDQQLTLTDNTLTFKKWRCPTDLNLLGNQWRKKWLSYPLTYVEQARCARFKEGKAVKFYEVESFTTNGPHLEPKVDFYDNHPFNSVFTQTWIFQNVVTYMYKMINFFFFTP